MNRISRDEAIRSGGGFSGPETRAFRALFLKMMAGIGSVLAPALFLCAFEVRAHEPGPLPSTNTQSIESALAAAEEPISQSPVLIDKRRIAGYDPEYPAIARTAQLEPTLLVKVFVTPDGEVGSFQFIKGHPLFDEAVEKALRTWRFTPFLINGRAVGTYTLYEFVFRLH